MRTLKPIAPFSGISATYAGLIRKTLAESVKKGLDAIDASQDKKRSIADSLGKDVTSTAYASNIVKKVNQRHKKTLNNRIKNNLKVGVSSIKMEKGIDDYLRDKIRENAGLITKLDGEVRQSIISSINRSLTDDSVNLKDEVKKAASIGNTRSRLIARDQVAKIQSQLHRKRTSNLGIEEYFWRITRDGRERKTHKEKDGTRQRHDTPPEVTGHYGEDVQCRCTGEDIVNVEALLQGTTTTDALSSYANNRTSPSASVIDVLKSATLPSLYAQTLHMAGPTVADGQTKISEKDIQSLYTDIDDIGAKVIYIIEIKKGKRIIEAGRYPAVGIKANEVILPHGINGKIIRTWQKDGITYIKARA